MSRPPYHQQSIPYFSASFTSTAILSGGMPGSVHPILQQVGDEQHLADLFSEGCTEGLGHAVKIDVERIEQRPVERMRRRDGLSGFCRAVAVVDERLIHALVEQRHAVYLHVEFHNAESISIARASAVFAPFASLATPNTNAPSIHAVVSASRSG